MSDPAISEPIQEFLLKQESELRFEVETGSTVSLQLLNGKAEVFGTELLQTIDYRFDSQAKIAVFTWHGCRLKLSGKTEVTYISSDTPMVMYVNTHAALEQMRQKAEKDHTRGPRAMLVGPKDVGKSTLCRILLNYGLRVGHRPILVDLDVGQGAISLPGTVGAVVPEKPLDPVSGYINENPVVYHFGHLSPADNEKLYHNLIDLLVNVCDLRCSNSRRADISGLLINTCGFVKGSGYRSLLHTAEQFKLDVVFVMDQERLYNELKRDLPSEINLVLLPKSPGVVERSQANRREARDKRVKEYFYGVKHALTAHRVELPFAEIEIFKIGAPSLPASLLPLDTEQDDCETKLVPVKLGPDLSHKVLSVSLAECEDDIIETNIAGFVIVQEVNVEKKVLSVLSPRPYPLPSCYFIMGDLSYMDLEV